MSDFERLLALVNASASSLKEAGYKPLSTREAPNPGPPEMGPLHDPKAMEALDVLSSSLKQMNALISPTPMFVILKAIGFHVSSAIRVVLQARAADVMLSKPGGMHGNDIATFTGIEPYNLAR